MEGSWRSKLGSAAITIMLVCLGVRVAAVLIEPVLPGLLVLGGLLAFGSVLFRGPHYR